MNNLKLLPIIAIILACVLAPDAHATNYLPPSPVVLPMQQQDDKARPVQLGENRGEIPEGDSEIWTYQGQAGEILTIKAEADKPANEAGPRKRRQAGLLDMLLIVYAPDGTILAKADNIQTSIVTDAALEGLQLPTAGTYQIEVLGWEKRHSGPYTLTLQAASPILAKPTPTINPDWPTLTIENQLEDTICYVYIWPTSVDEAGDEWLGTKQVILPYNEHQWHVAPDQYHIVLSDCYGNTLELRRQFDMTQSSTLKVSPSATDRPEYLCAKGVQLFFEEYLAEALPLLEVGFVERESVIFARSDDEGIGICALALGLLRNRTGDRSGALEAYQVAVDIFRASGSRGLEASALNNLGAVYDHRGKYDQAVELYQKALEVYREVDHRVGEGTSANNIGTVYNNQGKYHQALEQFQQALLISREMRIPVREGVTLNNMGTVYDNLGKYDQALVYYEQALEIYREIDDPASEGTTAHNIGVTYLHQRKYDQALEQLQKSLLISREVRDRDGEGRTLSLIGSVYNDQGKYDQALAYYEQAFEIHREVDDRASEGAMLDIIGTIYDVQGKHDQALDYFQKSLKIRREVGDRTGEGATLNNIGIAYQLQGQAEEALANYEKAMDVVEAVRTTAGGEEERASFIAQYANLYYRAIRLYHQQGQDEEAFLTSERGRARSFLDSLATGYVQLLDNDLQELLALERDAYNQRFAIRDELIRARVQNPSDEELVAELELQLEELDTAYSKALATIEAREDELAALVPGRSSVSTLAEVQALLDEQTTLLSYWTRSLGPVEGWGEKDRAFAFVITADELTVVELPDPTPENLGAALEHVYPFIKKDNAHPLPLRDLHSWLVAPLAEHLKTPKVGIIAHQQLHQVPFAALTDGESYFGEQHMLFSLPSASALSHIEKNAATLKDATRPALVFGNPTTGEEGFGSLAYAGQEAASVASLLDTSVYTQTEAHEARLWSEAVGAPVVHLAAHGSYNSGNALYSAIHLAPQGEYDGRLETREVYGLDLSAAEMVVLSACQTNVGETSRGDDIVGLTRAFFFAKTPTLVSSLWNVDDEATELLMSAFYRNWQSGMGKAQALQAAQAEVRANPKWAGPYYWAGFVVNGDPGEVREPPAEGRFWMVIVGMVGLLAVMGLVISRWRKKEEPS